MNPIADKLFGWLDETFNDYYIIQHPSFTPLGFTIVKHLPETPNENFWQLLNNFFPSLEKGYNLWISRDDKWRKILCEEGEIILAPYDNQICHTEYVKGKENNG